MLLEPINMIKKDLSIGVFDGLHSGHLKLLSNLINKPTIITFHPHPKKDIKLIYPYETRLKLLNNLGFDNIICYDDKDEIYKYSALDFIERILCKLKITNIYISSDFKLGMNRATDADQFKSIAENYKIKVSILDPVIYKGEKLSSSKIRAYLLNGEIKNANQMLVNNFFINGKIELGTKTAEKLGYKTANIYNNNNLILPKDGVYKTKTIYKNILYKSISYIGKSPTLLNKEKSLLETHIFNFNKTIYDEYITVIFIDKIRDDIVFKNKEKLLFQIKKDIEIATSEY